MQILLTKGFQRFARREGLAKQGLCEAVARAERGSVDAVLGGGLIKQRVARAGKGRSGGYRTVIAYQAGRRSIFLHGFAKSQRQNISDVELVILRKLAKDYLALSDDQVEAFVIRGEIEEIDYEEEA